MPELPEVETVVGDLRKKIVDKKIKRVEVILSKIIRNKKKFFCDFLVGQKIKKVKRRGKLILIFFDEKILTIHLRMTGQLILQEENKIKIQNKRSKSIIKNKIWAGGHNQKGMLDNLPNKFTHIIFYLSQNNKLFYNDVRQFGYLELVSPTQLNKILLKFGYEPLEINFTSQEFKKITRKAYKKNIKAFLLDQSLIAGIGNIYADEILFVSKIKPERKVGELNQGEIKNIFQNIKKILKKAIEYRGTTFNDYRDADGEKGGFKKFLKVYQRAGKKCLRKNCSGIIQKTKIASRGTHFCNICQK